MTNGFDNTGTGREGEGSYLHRVEFKDIDGMRPGSAVQMMGVRVGQVEEVTPVISNENSHVKLKFVITEPGIDIPRASEISIQQSGIIGEKYIEISPPKIREVYLPAESIQKKTLRKNDPVELLVDGNYVGIGKIKSVEIIDTKTLSYSQQAGLSSRYAYKVGYIVTMPGLIVPDSVSVKIMPDAKSGNNYKMELTPPEHIIVQLPETASEYTIIEPMRLKDFLDLQVRAAASLTETNEKINAMMSGETIQDIKTTLKNIKTLSAKANDTFDKTALLVDTSRTELQSLMSMASNLTNKLGVLTDNINGIVGDPEFKGSLIATTKSLSETSNRISELISDTKTKETLQYINNTAKNLSELSAYLNNMTQDEQLKTNFNETLVNLNTSLQKLSESLDTVKNMTDTQEENIKDIINNTNEAAKNLNKFSEKLNKRFLLFKLMF